MLCSRARLTVTVLCGIVLQRSVLCSSASASSVDAILVSESGIRDRRDVERLREAGIHAMLVGESLMASDSVGDKIRKLRAR